MQLQRLLAALPCASLVLALAACATPEEQKAQQEQKTAAADARAAQADCPTGTMICRRSPGASNVHSVSGESVQNTPTTFKGLPAK